MKSDNSSVRTKGRKKFRCIRTNVILWRYFALFAVGIILLVAVVCYTVLGNSLIAQQIKRVEEIGVELTDFVNDPRISDEIKEARLNEYALYDNVTVFVISEDGIILYPQMFVAPDRLGDITEEVNENMPEWNEDAVAEYNTGDGDSMTYNYVSCVRFGGTRAMLLIRYPISPIAYSIKQTQLYVILISLFVLVVAFVISYSLAERISRPIRDLSDNVSKLADGDFSVQFTSTDYAEVATLSDNLNYMRDEIKKSDDFQKELLANVTHDLKTPLTMIKAYASMIQEISGDNPEKRNKHLSVIIEESDRLTGLVNDILITSKIRSGLGQLNKKVFNLTEFLYGIIAKFGYLQETQGYKIMVDVDPNMYTLADDEKVGQVIYNLISNAVNYTGEDKTIYISLKYVAETNCTRFSVRDTGKGIDEEERQHIWERYYRSKDSHTRPVKGTGLGLNIVKIILDAHAFNFGVSSEEGKGSTFFVDFPSVSSIPEDGGKDQ